MEIYSDVSDGSNMPVNTENKVKITPLGGLKEIGKNVTAIETEKDMIVIDCGCSFPDTEEAPGIDKVYPDLTYITKNKEKLRALIITHGHEDHIGAVMYFIKNIGSNVPIYCSDFTWALLEEKSEGVDIKNKHHIVMPGNKKKISESFTVEFIHVNHSIPGALALAITTPQGVLLHTGDFKIDMRPSRGEMADLTRIGQLGKKGVRVLMMDSTNAEEEGFSKSESVVSKTLENVFSTYSDRRIIISTFSSNIYRLCKIIELSEKQGRKVAVAGRSIETSISAAAKIGLCNFKQGTLIPANKIEKIDDNKLTILSTGAQGELTAALNRMIEGTHPKVKIERNDVVVISSHAIPGNKKKVDTIINKLYDKGAVVICDKNAEIHASGHANKEEQRLILSLAKPEYYMPVHGEALHLRAAKRTGLQMGIDSKNIIITKNGGPIMLSKDGIKKCSPVENGAVYIDGDFENELNYAVIKDRQTLMQDGVVVISTIVDVDEKEVLSPVTVNSRGFIYMNDSAKLVQDISREAKKQLDYCFKTGKPISEIRGEVSKAVTKYIHQQTGKSPLTLVMLNYT